MPMVALGCGVAMIPDVVVQQSPVANQISHIQLETPIDAFELGVCVQQRRLQEPIIRAFWELLSDLD